MGPVPRGRLLEEPLDEGDVSGATRDRGLGLDWAGPEARRSAQWEAAAASSSSWKGDVKTQAECDVVRKMKLAALHFDEEFIFVIMCLFAFLFSSRS